MAEFKRCPEDSPFCLGMEDFECCNSEDSSNKENLVLEEPSVERKKLSDAMPKVKKGALSPSSRFNKAVSDFELEKSSKGCIPRNTERATGWAIRTFEQWCEQRNKRCEEQCPSDLFDKPYEAGILCLWLQRFVSEARKADGTPYPPKTLYQILCGLLRHSREQQEDPPNFLDRSGARFKKLRGACDALFRELHTQGIGAEKKSTQPLTTEHENKLWGSGVLGTTAPEALQRAVFFSVGKVCCLWGGEEQRELKPSQLTRLYDPDRYIYTEHGSKNRNGGFNQLQIENKSVPIFMNPAAGIRCLVSLLDKYIAKFPEAAKNSDVFYCRPLEKPCDTGPWYSSQPRGKHTLNNMVKTMCRDAGIEGHFTNHSLRAMGATELFQHNVPEKVVQEFTGHRSLKSLRQYKKGAMKQKMAASNILTGTFTATSFEQEMEQFQLKESAFQSSLMPPMKQFPGISGAVPMPLFSPVINSQGPVNFTVNICPTGTVSVGCSTNSSKVEDLLEEIDLEEFLAEQY